MAEIPHAELTVDDLFVGLAEWHRRWQADPDGFRPMAAMLEETPEANAAADVRYLVELIAEIGPGRPGTLADYLTGPR